MAALRILIVEDETIIAMELVARLGKMGYEVTGVAHSGRRALEMIQESPPDLVLMDIRLQGDIDGIGTAAAMRQRGGVPVVFLTAYNDEETILRARETAPFGYLAKPFDKRQICATIEMSLYRHGIERKLAEREQCLSAVLSSIGDGVIVTDDEGKTRYMNPAAEIITGWFLEESVGKPLGDIYRTVRTGSCGEESASRECCSTGGRPQETIMLLRRNGTEMYVRENRTFLDAVNGGSGGQVLIVRDDTERTATFLELQQEKDRVERYLSLAGAVIVVLDWRGRVVMINSQGSRVLGYKEQWVIGRDWFELAMPPEGRRAMKRVFDRLMSGEDGSPAFCEHAVRTADGRERVIAWRISVLRNAAGEVEATVCSGEDVTELHAAIADLRAVQRNGAGEEDRIGAIIETIDDPVSILGRDYRIRYQNRAHEERFGRQHDRQCWEIYGRSTSMCPGCPNEHSLVEGSARTFEMTIRCGDGMRCFEVVSIGLVAPSGAVTAAIEVMRDITSRKAIEERLCLDLEVSRVRNSIATAVMDPRCTVKKIADITLHHARLLTGSEFAFVMIYPVDSGGEDKEEPTAAFDVFFPPEAETLYRQLRPYLSSFRFPFFTNEMGAHVALAEAPVSVHDLDSFLEVPLMADDETIGALALAASPRGYSERELSAVENLAEMCSLAIRNLRAVERLREERHFIVDVLNGIRDGICVIDQERKIVLFNRTLEEWFSYCGSLVGRTWEDLLIASGGGGSRLPLAGPVDGGEAGGEIRAISLADGRRRTMEVHLFPLSTPGDRQRRRMIVHMRDITEKLTLQAEVSQSSQLASLGELAAGLAHEINNPVNGIVNYAQILLNRCNGNGEEELPRRIIKEGQRVSSIVSNLLSFARADMSARERHNVGDLLENVLSLCRSQLQRQGIAVRLDLGPGLPPVLVNRQQLEQVFLNLINNSRYTLEKKYPCPDGRKVIEIAGTASRNGRGTVVSLEFLDRGMGIPAAILDRVTEPFFTTKPKGEGTGLGLSLSRRIVADLGGSLSVESDEGEFTRVTVKLPIDEWE